MHDIQKVFQDWAGSQYLLGLVKDSYAIKYRFIYDKLSQPLGTKSEVYATLLDFQKT